MKKEMRRSEAQTNYTQRNYMQGTYHKDTYNSHKKQYREISQGYYMYTANAVAHEYQYEEEIQQPAQKTHRKSVKSRPVLAQHISTLLVVFLMGLVLVGQYAYIQNLGYQVSQSKAELKAVQDQNEKIKKQIAAMGDLQNVEAVAVNNMGMHKPAEWEIIYLPQTTKEENNGPEQQETDLNQAVDQVRQVLGTILA